MNNDLTLAQKSIANQLLDDLGAVQLGELRLSVRACFHAAVARSIIDALTGYPWYFGEEAISRFLEKSKATLSFLKTPGKMDPLSPAFTALHKLWSARLDDVEDRSVKDAVQVLFQRSRLLYYERLGILTTQRHLSGIGNPGQTKDIMTARAVQMLRDLIFRFNWVPDKTFDLTAVILNSGEKAEPTELNEINALAAHYGISSLLFYRLAAEEINHD